MYKTRIQKRKKEESNRAIANNVSEKSVCQQKQIVPKNLTQLQSKETTQKKAFPKVMQLAKTSVAILGQGHNDVAFLQYVMSLITALKREEIPFKVVIEEPPGVSVDEMIGRCNEVIDHPTKYHKQSVLISKAELPIYEFLKENEIDLTGVDSPLINDVSPTEMEAIDALELDRLKAMTEGILGAAGSLAEESGGLVLGINFGSSHIGGLNDMLKSQKSEETSISSMIATGGYRKKDRYKDARRLIRSQYGKIEESTETSDMRSRLYELYDETVYDESDLKGEGISLTHTDNYGDDLESFINESLSFLGEEESSSSETSGSTPSVEEDITD